MALVAAGAVGEEGLGYYWAPVGGRVGTGIGKVVGVAVKAEGGWDVGGVKEVVEDASEGSPIGLMREAKALVGVVLTM